MKNIEIIDGKVYNKEQEEALQKQKEYLEKSIISFKKDLQDVEAKIRIQNQQKADIQAKKAVIAELEKEKIEFNEADSKESLEKLLPPKPEPVKEEVEVEEPVKKLVKEAPEK